MSARAEAKKGPGAPVVEFRGLTLPVPPMAEWPVDVFEAFEDDQMIRAMRGILGAESWSRFKALDPAPTMADLSALVSEIAAVAGLASAGES